MTEVDYILESLVALCRVLDERGIDVLEATGEQAWDAFLVVLARDPHGKLAQSYGVCGSFYRDHFAEIWFAFQVDVFEAIGAL